LGLSFWVSVEVGAGLCKVEFLGGLALTRRAQLGPQDEALTWTGWAGVMCRATRSACARVGDQPAIIPDGNTGALLEDVQSTNQGLVCESVHAVLLHAFAALSHRFACRFRS
jgi:hypothetical protein